MSGFTSYIIKKLRTYPARYVAINMIKNTTAFAAFNCLASVIGEEVLALNQVTTAAQIGAAGGAALGAIGNLTKSTYTHFSDPEDKSTLEQKPAEEKMRCAAIACSEIIDTAKPISFAVLGSMLGYAILNTPSEILLANVATSAAIGSATLMIIPVTVAVISYSIDLYKRSNHSDENQTPTLRV